MVLFKEIERSWLENLCIKILQCGPIPQHIAIIMDGNRRYARKLNTRLSEGHNMGATKIFQTVQHCMALGIKELTVYAFSIENFKREPEEVEDLMELTRRKFQNFLEQQEDLKKSGVSIRVFGQISLLPLDIQKLLSEVVCATQCNNKFYFNVCAAYTSRDEIATAIRELAEGVRLQLIKPEDVTEEMIDKCLWTSDSLPLNLLIRTSGEKRLSDFLLWQSSFSVLAFVSVLWPEFSIWNLFKAVLFYQYHYTANKALLELNKKMRQQNESDEEPGCKDRKQAFIKYLRKKRMNELQKLKYG